MKVNPNKIYGSRDFISELGCSFSLFTRQCNINVKIGCYLCTFGVSFEVMKSLVSYYEEINLTILKARAIMIGNGK